MKSRREESRGQAEVGKEEIKRIKTDGDRGRMKSPRIERRQRGGSLPCSWSIRLCCPHRSIFWWAAWVGLSGNKGVIKTRPAASANTKKTHAHPFLPSLFRVRQDPRAGASSGLPHHLSLPFLCGTVADHLFVILKHCPRFFWDIPCQQHEIRDWFLSFKALKVFATLPSLFPPLCWQRLWNSSSVLSEISL